ncbi:MAG: relaxase/mobilization nuclease domain-containing protein [Methylophaga sp.]|uniref:relaxase/mobilization nuclease domain-containing protein n=1 Tax=Methylophaga sp. TaxID=2024840 RepID=UPI00299F0A7A|nr:relaxase/mobilization nuclease domain-containing protein [Methylophaga sp.]MDX1749067.1 relaxase/mobilization nuclease domain-containing protein [Methylophaga sp.]
MHIKFLEYGTGQALDAVKYLLAVTDAKGESRAGVEVLSGDLYQLASLADSLDFKYRYSSAVVSFHPDDNPTDVQVEALIDELEKTLFAGLDPEQYCWGVVRHDDNAGGFHLHIIIARVELRTGKSFNPAPPGWQKTFDPLRDYFNARYGWKSPDIDAHPENAREIQPGHRAYQDVRKAVTSGVEDPRQVIIKYVQEGIVNGLVNDRKDMIAYLKDAGFEIPRVGKNYITVLEPGLESGNRWRLKGALFDENFDLDRTLAAKAASGDGIDRKPDPTAAATFYKQLEQKRRERARYNQKKYQQSKRTATRRHQRAGKSSADLAQEMEADLAYAAVGESLPVGGADTAGSIRRVETETTQSRGSTTAPAVEPAQGGTTKPQGQKLRRQGVRTNRRNSSQVQQRLPDPPAVTKHVYFHQHLQVQLLGDVLPFNDIKFINVNQGLLQFADGSHIDVSKKCLTANKMSDEKAALRLIACAKARQWQVIKLSGSLAFFELAAELAFKDGIDVIAQTPQQKMVMEKMYERERINRARAAIAETIKKSERSLDVIKSAPQRTRELHARFTEEVGRNWFSQPGSGLSNYISFNKDQTSQIQKSQQQNKTIS